MAKIKHNNFLDTVDEVISNAKNAGVLHLYADGESFTGRKIGIDGRELFHFGTTGYLGLEQDERLKNAAIDAIKKYGTQFPLSKSYISHPLYNNLEEKLFEMYGYPVIITKNSTLGHMAVIPCVVRDEDGVILDHQVHWSVQSATQILKTRAIPVEMIRHNNMGMLEDKIKSLSSKCNKIWYMADGIYSMYGDYAPIPELLELCKKYPQLHLYFDDVHGMSWIGKNGTGYVLDLLKELPKNIIVFGTLSKTFGASGAVLVCADKKMHSKIKNFGGPLTFSAQLEPASVAAATASAKIHLSSEIYLLQNELQDKINYFNSLLCNTNLPLVEENNSPVFFIGTGMPATGYNFVKRLMKEGFYVNLGLFPAVPVKNTGVRITISRHNEKMEIKKLVEAMEYHYPKALQETHTSSNRVRRAFKLPEVFEKREMTSNNLQLQYETSIEAIDKMEWNKILGKKSVFDWDGLKFLEQVFKNNEKYENNWTFHYFIIKDHNFKVVLATFFTYALWKEDMLSPVSVSSKLEEKRVSDPYFHTSYVLSMGSLFTEGDHLFLDKSHSLSKNAVHFLNKNREKLERKLDPSMIVYRDFNHATGLNELLHEQGFIKINMPDSCVMEDLSWNTKKEYLSKLSSRSRRHFKNEIEPYEPMFDVTVLQSASEEQVKVFYQLYKNVKNNNTALNTFTYPKKLFTKMASSPFWEFIVLKLKKDLYKDEIHNPVGVMFCYKNMNHSYVPNLIGMDYHYSKEFHIYRQLLYQTIKRAKDLNFKKIDFGMTASFEKRKVGATVIPKFSYVQAKDNYSLEVLGLIENGTN